MQWLGDVTPACLLTGSHAKACLLTSPYRPTPPAWRQVDFPLDDPIEIIKRLMIGSEGTLGFVSQATYNTVPEWPHKASAFIVFPDVMSACQGASGGCGPRGRLMGS
jgi:hypothetical protein